MSVYMRGSVCPPIPRKLRIMAQFRAESLAFLYEWEHVMAKFSFFYVPNPFKKSFVPVKASIVVSANKKLPAFKLLENFFRSFSGPEAKIAKMIHEVFPFHGAVPQINQPLIVTFY